MRHATLPCQALGLTAAEFEQLNSQSPHPIAYRELFSWRSAPSRRVSHWAQSHGLQLNSLRKLSQTRGGRSTKFLFGLPDGYAVETVRIQRQDGQTACVSSQVGCAFACQFCASGQAGLKRNLTAAEMVEQVIQLGPQVNRLVFMGIGEPLNNYEQVLRAIRILRDRTGRNFSTRGMTISTIGIPKMLERLREEHLALNLTISLHATTQAMRDQLIPGTRKHPLPEVLAAALAWAERHQRVVTFAYLLLPGLNDSPEDAGRLAQMLQQQRARVNLMRWNPVSGVPFARIADAQLVTFKNTLERAGVPVVVRDTQGRDITAACGQLWLRNLEGQTVSNVILK